MISCAKRDPCRATKISVTRRRPSLAATLPHHHKGGLSQVPYPKGSEASTCLLGTIGEPS